MVKPRDDTDTALLSPEASYLTLDIIKDTTRPITYNNTKHNLPIYWKTGTSSSFRDALSVGIFTYLPFGLGISKDKLTEHLQVISLQPLYSLILSNQ